MEQKIETLSSYIEKLDYIFNSKNKENAIYWFRGEANSNWASNLIPASYRSFAEKNISLIDSLKISNQIIKIENNCCVDFYRKSYNYLKNNTFNNYDQRYFLMQHYGIKTRLLDWTENALVALYFSLCDKNQENNDAIVWILDPLELNNFTIQKITHSKNKNYDIILTSLSHGEKSNLMDNDLLELKELKRRYFKADFSPNKYTNDFYPLAIYPPLLDNRMTAQKSCFTIFGNYINGLMLSKKKLILDSITIKYDAKKIILEELKKIGFDQESVFPDLDGLGSSIKNTYEKYY